MWLNHVTQVDVAKGRFWMDLCAGRDQVAMAVHGQGWAAYEAPLPGLLAAWCQRRRPVVVDVGANTGFYSLLAAASGATQVLAVEPVAEIAEVLRANLALSELAGGVNVHAAALASEVGEQTLYFPAAEHGLVETSASLNAQFRDRHSQQRQVPVLTLDGLLLPQTVSPTPVLIKIDVESAELAVLAGGAEVLRTLRPAIVAEVLPGADLSAWQAFMQQWDYEHHSLRAEAPHIAPEPGPIVADLARPDHLFLPRESAALWLAA